MTQTSATSRWSYTGNAVTTTFAYTTRIFATTDLDVYLDGVLQSSGYSVTGAGDNSGGNVVFTSAPGSGVVVVIVRDVPYTQETDLLDAGPAPMATIEDMVDKTTILTQQASDLIARSIRQPEADTTAIGRLPVKASRLGKLLQFNATTGDPEVVAAADIDLSTVTPFIETLLDDTTAAAARTTLGSTSVGDAVFVAASTAAARTAIGAVIGTDVQAYDADLAALAGLSGVRGDIIYRDATQWQRLAKGTSGQVLTMGANDPAWGVGGKIAQIVSTQTGAVATGTTTIPLDDTIPQNTEGDEYMTLAITPTLTTNKLRIDVTAVLSSTAATQVATALFQDSTASAIASSLFYNFVNGASTTVTFSHVMDAGTTSTTTFKVRAGAGAANTLTFNGLGGARYYGGTLASSIRITEYTP